GSLWPDGPSALAGSSSGQEGKGDPLSAVATSPLPRWAAERRKPGHGARLLVASPSPNVAKGSLPAWRKMTDEARVIALDRLRPGDIADPSGELLDVVFGWADFARLRRQVAAQCAAAGLTRTRLDDFVLAVHEIAANAIVHAGAGGRLILRRA